MKVTLRLFAWCVLLAALGAALAPWTIGGPHVRSGLAMQIKLATGWNAAATGPITIKVLPRPRIQIARFHLDDGRGHFELDAAGLYGDIDVGALLTGRWRLTSATLIDPTVTLDANSLPWPKAGAIPATTSNPDADSRVLPAYTASIGSKPADQDGSAANLAVAGAGSFKVALRSGVIRVKSDQPEADTLITDINATIDKAGRDASLTVAGKAVWHGSTGQFAARIDQPDNLLRGGEATARLELVSSLGAFTASGQVTQRRERQFAGHITVSTPTLPGLMRAFGLSPPAMMFGRVLLSGDTVAQWNDVSLSGIRLKLDQTAFEGTLGFRRQGGRPLIEGTLATDMLDLDQFARTAEDKDNLALWYGKPFDTRWFKTNVDLRVSAASSRMGPIGFEDTALALLLHDGQLELTLDEARAFSGTIKAKAVARLVEAGIEGHADIAVANVDLGPLSSVIAGEERISGAMTGQVGLDGHGNALSDVVHHLSGQGQLSVADGNFMGLSVTQALHRLSRRLPLGADPSGQITAFDKATSRFEVENGVINIAEGLVSGPGMRLQFGGHTDLKGGKIQLKAVASATNAAGSVLAGMPRLPIEMRGNWSGPVHLVEHATGVELPDWTWPLMDQPRLMR